MLDLPELRPRRAELAAAALPFDLVDAVVFDTDGVPTDPPRSTRRPAGT